MGRPFDLPEEHRSQYGHKLPCVGEALSLPKGRGVDKTIRFIEEAREDRKLLVVDKWGRSSMLGHQPVRILMMFEPMPSCEAIWPSWELS